MRFRSYKRGCRKWKLCGLCGILGLKTLKIVKVQGGGGNPLLYCAWTGGELSCLFSPMPLDKQQIYFPSCPEEEIAQADFLSQLGSPTEPALQSSPAAESRSQC